MSLSDTVEATVRAEVAGIVALGNDVLVSGTYLYPVKGIYYFVRNPELWKPLQSRMVPLVGLSTTVITLMFLLTYIPQSFILTLVSGPVAWISTIALVLSESAAIIAFLSRRYVIADALVDTFDAVLLKEGLAPLVKTGREVKPGSGKMGKLSKKPLAEIGMEGLFRYFLLLPLNFIPFLGTVVFIFVQGRKAGPSYHARYFQLKGWSAREQKAFVQQNKSAYMSFGAIAMLLQLIPIVSIFCSYTNTVGAALWAADIELNRRPGQGKRVGGVTPAGSGKREF
ncbi:hypothetical protein RUND412_010400 [Rhizina undulata]